MMSPGGNAIGPRGAAAYNSHAIDGNLRRKTNDKIRHGIDMSTLRLLTLAISVVALAGMSWLAVTARESAAEGSADKTNPVAAVDVCSAHPPPPSRMEPASGPAREGTARTPTSEEPAVAPAELKLLSEIRHEIGSPIDASAFGAAIGDGPGAPEASFDAAYRKAAAQGEFHAVPFPPPRAAESLGQPSGPPNPERQFHASLREAARHLEATAADLEDAEQFDRADQLRAWTMKLRRAARHGAGASEDG